ncbi:MAG: DUF4249 family protein [Bacteroidetes bacterium]|nr:DUF4249 family protein [Bacteroidota bacterium]
MRPGSLLIIVFFLGACDAVQPENSPILVVEAFVMPGEPLPEIILRQTTPLRSPYHLLDQSTAASGAQVDLRMKDELISYSMQDLGRYMPLDPVIAVPGASLGLTVQWENQSIMAESQVPPPISLDSISISVSDAPVQGLLLDSVFIDPFLVDSLGLQALGAGAREGLVYLVEATLYWTDSSSQDSNEWWMRTQLLPNLGEDRRLSDYFLSPEVVQLESEIPSANSGQRSWSGAYAVPVGTRGDQVPGHELRVSIIRCTQAYADFISGRSNPSETEPPSNIVGGVGIFAGLALDTLTIEIQ